MKTITIPTALRAVARAYYNTNDPRLDKEFGICHAMVLLSGTVGFGLSLLLERGGFKPRRGSLYLCAPGTRWGQRAMFCLVFAEYLDSLTPKQRVRLAYPRAVCRSRKIYGGATASWAVYSTAGDTIPLATSTRSADDAWLQATRYRIS